MAKPPINDSSPYSKRLREDTIVFKDAIQAYEFFVKDDQEIAADPLRMVEILAYNDYMNMGSSSPVASEKATQLADLARHIVNELLEKHGQKRLFPEA